MTRDSGLPDGVKSCCRDADNLVEHRERPDLVIRKCRVCGCRHFEATMDMGRYGLTGKTL